MDVIDIEQVIIRGQLVLGVELSVSCPAAQIRRALDSVQVATGLAVDMSIDPDPQYHQSRNGRHHVIALGRPLRPESVSAISQNIAGVGANIDSIRRLSDYPVTAIELMVSGARSTTLRALMSAAAAETGVDIAVERVGLDRRGKRLIMMDVDSTLVQGEVIDQLAARAGRSAEVAAITERAMAGELDFTQSLHQRVGMLVGLPLSAVDEVRRGLQLTPGARTLIRTLKRMGYRIGIVSGGFTQITDKLATELQLDYALANTLEVADGVLTGRVVGTVVDRAGKAQALKRFAKEFDVPLSQTVAVGDGANDLDMLAKAGLGIAFNAKPVVREMTEVSLNQPYLDAILFFLGISRDEVAIAPEAAPLVED